MRISTRQRGFTLVELVIAVSILTIVLSVAYSTLSYVIRTKKLIDDRQEIAAIANAVLLRMSREIQLATEIDLLPPPGGHPPGKTVPSLRGTKNNLAANRGDTLEFMAEEGGQYIPEGLANTGTVMIRYRVEKDPDSPKGAPSSYLLIRDEVPDIRPPSKAWEKLMTFPIAKNVVRLQFSYYNGVDRKWVEEWDPPTKDLPSLIRMVLTIRSPAGVEHEFMTVLPTE